MRATHYGSERRETQEACALRLLGEEMSRLGWNESALRQAGKGDERKVRLAARLRKETTMSLKWIAQHLAMGYLPMQNWLKMESSRSSVVVLPTISPTALAAMRNSSAASSRVRLAARAATVRSVASRARRRAS